MISHIQKIIITMALIGAVNCSAGLAVASGEASIVANAIVKLSKLPDSNSITAITSTTNHIAREPKAETAQAQIRMVPVAVNNSITTSIEVSNIEGHSGILMETVINFDAVQGTSESLGVQQLVSDGVEAALKTHMGGPFRAVL